MIMMYMYFPLILLATSWVNPSSGAPLTLPSITSHPPYSLNLGAESRDVLNSNHVSSDTRTTPDIFWSCIATIFACTWVSMHPNLPDPRHSKWTQFMHRVGVMILALFAPEFILICALRQRIAAEEIMRTYNQVVFKQECGHSASVGSNLGEWFRDPIPLYARRSWTLTHGFYVQMGGFLLCDHEHDWPTRVLNFDDLLDLIQTGKVDPPQVSEEDICDKSKGDFLTKALVLLQTTWFIVQCVVRWILKLPVTELEVMTLSFAVLNIITYALWWEKPLNVGVGVRVNKKRPVRVTKETPPTAHRVIEEDITDSFVRDYELPKSYRDHGLVTYSQREKGDAVQGAPIVAQQGQVAPGDAIQESIGNVGPLHRSRGVRNCIAAVCLRRVLRASHTLYTGIIGVKLFAQLRKAILGPSPMPHHTPYPSMGAMPEYALSVGTFHAYSSVLGGGKARVISFAVASGVLFGSLHLIPWASAFPSPFELLLWRVSALYIMLNPLILAVPLAVSAFAYRSSADRPIPEFTIRLIRPLIPLLKLINACVPLYILARLVIIVLAFTTLRALPSGAYSDISWSSFVPHI